MSPSGEFGAAHFRDPRGNYWLDRHTLRPDLNSTETSPTGDIHGPKRGSNGGWQPSWLPMLPAIAALWALTKKAPLPRSRLCRSELVDPKIAEHRGRIVKTTGDGAAGRICQRGRRRALRLEIQSAMAERNAAIAEDRRIEFRIGINVGDIIIDEGDIYGDGVNIAARAGIAGRAPAAICISDNAYQQVQGQARRRLSATWASSNSRTLLSRCASTACGSDAAAHATAVAGAAREAVDRGAAVPEHERRSGAGIFRRRHGRGHHHRPVADQMAVRDRPQFELHLQGPAPST